MFSLELKGVTMKYYPKFDEKINEFISNNRFQSSKPRYGTIMSFNKMNNTAVVVLDERMTNQIGDILKNVPCPSIQGIQTVAPIAGSRCVVGFTDANERFPYIISYVDETNSIGKYMPSYSVNTGVPKFLV